LSEEEGVLRRAPEKRREGEESGTRGTGKSRWVSGYAQMGGHIVMYRTMSEGAVGKYGEREESIPMKNSKEGP